MAGRSFLRARSPVMPKMTRPQGGEMRGSLVFGDRAGDPAAHEDRPFGLELGRGRLTGNRRVRGAGRPTISNSCWRAERLRSPWSDQVTKVTTVASMDLTVYRSASMLPP